MQRQPLTTELREEWDAMTADGAIDTNEMVRFAWKLAYVDDSHRAGMTIMRTGLDARRSREATEELDHLYGVICLDTYRTQRNARTGGTDPSIA